MNSLDDIVRWYGYNSYVRKKYLKTLSELTISKLSKRTESSFPTVLQIFLHILDAYRWWFIFVMEDRLRAYTKVRTRVKSISEANRLECEIDSLVMKFVWSLKPADLEREISWHEGKKLRRIKLDALLHHMIEEELQHRGEINAVLWQMNVDPPITGWDNWVNEIGIRSRRLISQSN
jgi:uncharacterized damage-inducible protein DinB